MSFQVENKNASKASTFTYLNPQNQKLHFFEIRAQLFGIDVELEHSSMTFSPFQNISNRTTHYRVQFR